MRTKTLTQEPQIRQRIAQLSAQLMIQEGIDDYYAAKCKAATQLGVPNTRHLPSNSEIEIEIIRYQRLFHPQTYRQQLFELRTAALQAMHLFTEFKPRLVGSVLEGSAHQHSEIVLHLFTHTPEDVVFFLIDHRIPYETGERRVRFSTQVVNYPSYQFMAGDHRIVLIVFGVDDIRRSPDSPIDGKPMRRADRDSVEKLLHSDGEMS